MASYQAYLQQLAAQIAQNNPNDPTGFLSPNLVGDFNDPTIDGSGYGVLTGAAQMQTYYAYYNAITSTAPEIPDQTAYFIKYLIDKDGNVVKPQPGEVSAINLKDNFETGKIAISTARKPTVLFSDLLGEKQITHVGEISTILVSNTGSLPNQYVTTMSFEDITGLNLDTIPADFNFSARAAGYNDGAFYDGEVDGTIINDGVFERQLKNNMLSDGYINFQVQNSPDIAAGIWNGSTYTFAQSTINGNGRVKFRISLNLRVFRVKQNRISGNYSVDDGETSSVNIRYRISKNGSPLAYSSWITVYNNDGGQYPSFDTSYYNFQSSDNITFFIEFDAQRNSYNESWPNRFYNKNLVMYTFSGVSGIPSGTSVIEVINENQNFSGDINGINIATAPYWYIGEFPDQNGDTNAIYTQTSVITASLGMSQLYRPNIIYRLHPSCSAYGYSRPWQTYYELLPGDKIIFENNKFNTHTITEIITTNIETPSPESSSSFGLRLSPGVPTGSIINNFCIYRIIDNGTYIVLNQPKPDISGSLQGFLIPKYITPELSDSVKDTTYKLDVNGLLDQ
jgi:hypothetical protein